MNSFFLVRMRNRRFSQGELLSLSWILEVRGRLAFRHARNMNSSTSVGSVSRGEHIELFEGFRFVEDLRAVTRDSQSLARAEADALNA